MNSSRQQVRWALGALLLLALAVVPGERGAVLGGWRPVVAGICWLRTNQAWERRDAAATRLWLHLTVATDERPLTFWFNGARMLACDLPEWGMEDDMPVSVRRQRRIAAGREACGFLRAAERVHPGDPAVLIELANLQLRVLDDRAEAARLLREAALLPGAPYFAARVHAELLCELGRPREALAWLREVLPRLPSDDPAAQREVVRQRIKALEAGGAGP